MSPDAGFVVENDAVVGQVVVLTGPWSKEAARALERSDGLVINYARGFTGDEIEFLDESMEVRYLKLLDRSIRDLTPITRLSASLEGLSIQAAEEAELDLGSFPGLTQASGDWALLGRTISSADSLREVTTWRFDDSDLHVLRDLFELRRLTIKDAPALESLEGVESLNHLTALEIGAAQKLSDIDAIHAVAETLCEFKLEACRAVDAIDSAGAATKLQRLGISDCGDIDSLAPVARLEGLEELSAWGTTRILDGDLSPLLGLTSLREVRMRDRRTYRPRVSEVVAALTRNKPPDA